MAKKLHLVHVKSNVLDKAPSASTIGYGEIAVNYNADSPALYIKDDEDNIVKFISELYFEKIVGTGVTENDGVTITPISKVIQEDEEVVSAALNDLNDRKADKSDLDDAISGLTEYIDEQLSAATIEVDSELDSGSTNPVENRAIWKVIVDDEEAIAASLNDLNARKADKEYVDEAISGITFDVDDHLDSASTNPIENRVLYQIIAEDERVTAAALNDLNDRKAEKEDLDEAVSGLTEYIDEQISDVAIEVDSELDSASTNPVENRAIWEFLEKDEKAISAAFNDLNTRKANITYVDGLVSELAKADTSFSNALGRFSVQKADRTYVDAMISNVAVTVDSALDSASTNPVENKAIWKVIVDNELIVSSALNDLNDNKADRSELSDFADINDVAITGVTQSGSGNAVTAVTVSDKRLTVSKGDVSGGGGEQAVTGVTISGSGNAVTNATFSDKLLTLTKGNVQETISDLASIRTSASTQPDWNASTGVAAIQNKPAVITGVTMNSGSKTVTNGVVDLGTVVTAQTQLSTGATQGSGNVVTSLAVSNHQITLTKGITIPAWATASTKPSYTASEVGALASNATLDNVSDGTTRKLSNYATVTNFNSHTGDTTAHVTSAEKSTWNGKQDSISDLGTIRSNASSGASAYTAVTSHTGNTGIHVPSHSVSDANKVLGVDSNGNLAWITPTIIYTGTNTPDSNLGNDGDIYLQTS